MTCDGGSSPGRRHRQPRGVPALIDGTWERVFTALLAQADAEGDLDRVVAVDSTIVRADQHASGAHPNGPRPCAGAQPAGREPASSCQQGSQARAYSKAQLAPQNGSYRRRSLPIRRTPREPSELTSAGRAFVQWCRKRPIRSPHANAVADPVAGRRPSLVRERNKTTPNTAHQAVPDQEPPPGPARRGFLTSHLLSHASHQNRRHTWITRRPFAQTAVGNRRRPGGSTSGSSTKGAGAPAAVSCPSSPSSAAACSPRRRSRRSARRSAPEPGSPSPSGSTVERAVNQGFELLRHLVQRLHAALRAAHGDGALDGRHDEGREPRSLLRIRALVP